MNEPDDIEIKKIKSADRDDIIRLYKDAGWWKPEYDDNTVFIDKIVENSACFIGAFKNGKMIGMGRALSDNASDAYIHDVIVLNVYRKKGIGGRIVKTVVEYLKTKNVDWIGLIGRPGTEEFYRKIGFSKMKDFIPMILRD